MQQQQKKIIIMGMENAGKTSIVNQLKEKLENPPNEPPYIKATMGLKISTLFNIAIWDFGGQEIYRNEYLNNPDRYFRTIDSFYYVVDVQDNTRLISSTMYFMGVFQRILKYKSDININFLFHKMDPDFDPNEKKLKEKFLEKIQPYVIAHKTSYTTYNTTIFDSNSIKIAFSQEI